MGDSGTDLCCLSCGTDWSRGQFSEDFEECGGGALERPCMVYGGRYGRSMKRAVIDFHDFRTAHWVGSCDLSREGQRAILTMKARQRGKRDT